MKAGWIPSACYTLFGLLLLWLAGQILVFANLRRGLAGADPHSTTLEAYTSGWIALENTQQRIEAWQALSMPLEAFLALYIQDDDLKGAWRAGLYEEVNPVEDANAVEASYELRWQFQASGVEPGPDAQYRINDLLRHIEIRLGREVGKASLDRFEQAWISDTEKGDEWLWDLSAPGVPRYPPLPLYEEANP